MKLFTCCSFMLIFQKKDVILLFLKNELFPSILSIMLNIYFPFSQGASRPVGRVCFQPT